MTATTAPRPTAVRFGAVEATFCDRALQREVISICESDFDTMEMTVADARELAAQLLAAADAIEAQV